jgi:hypothetical protein
MGFIGGGILQLKDSGRRTATAASLWLLAPSELPSG